MSELPQTSSLGFLLVSEASSVGLSASYGLYSVDGQESYWFLLSKLYPLGPSSRDSGREVLVGDLAQPSNLSVLCGFDFQFSTLT